MFGASLLVSVPGAALDGLDLPGSLVEAATLRDAPMPPGLRTALHLVAQACAASGTRLRLVARPEIFVHGAARAWLEARLDGARDHLALSDGATLRAIPGLRNHVFFHATSSLAAARARQRLLAVAPELLAGMASQVNGALSVLLDGALVRPPTVLLRGAPAPDDPGPLRAFACPIRNAEKLAAQIAESAPVEAPPGPLDFVPLCTAALDEDGFARSLARMIQRSATGAAPPLLLGLPPLDAVAAEPRHRIAAVLDALIATGIALPRAPGPRILLAEGDPRPEWLAGGRVTLHPAIEFWRFPPSLFEEAAGVEILGEGRLGPARRLLAEWSGRAVAARRPDRRPPAVAAGATA